MIHWIESSSYREYINSKSSLSLDFTHKLKILAFIFLISIIIPIALNLYQNGQLSFAFTISDIPETKIHGLRTALISFLFVIIIVSFLSACAKRFASRKINLGYFKLTLTANNWWNKDLTIESHKLYSLTHYEIRKEIFLNNEFEILVLHLSSRNVEVFLDSSINKAKLHKHLDQIILMKPREDLEWQLDDWLIR